jgi:predicted secreted hydrolase
MNARTWAAILLWFWASAAGAQGFAGMGAAPDGFPVPAPETRLSFPEDHGPHPEFRIEWWYLTANLEDADGTAYGVQWTLFRTALEPRDGLGWSAPQLWLAHAGLTTPTQHFAAEKLARGGIGQAGVTAAPFEAWIDDWQMAGPDLGDLAITANGPGFAYTLQAKANGPLVMQGQKGYSVKSRDGTASHYYSQPFYEITGALTVDGRDIAVTGSAWLDREWSSQPLSESQSGWDWVGLSFASGARLMGFRLRDTAAGDFTAATWIDPDGTPTPYPDGAFRTTPLKTHEVAGRDVPVAWRLELPDQDLDITIAAVNPNAWMATSFSYWEGPVTIEGSHPGVGYLEMTGYE